MKIQIYVLYGLIALQAVCFAYAALIFRQKLDEIESKFERKTKHVKDTSVVVADINRTVDSLLACDSYGDNCGACIVKAEDDLTCISKLTKHTIELLRAYRSVITDGQS